MHPFTNTNTKTNCKKNRTPPRFRGGVNIPVISYQPILEYPDNFISVYKLYLCMCLFCVRLCLCTCICVYPTIDPVQSFFAQNFDCIVRYDIFTNKIEIYPLDVYIGCLVVSSGSCHKAHKGTKLCLFIHAILTFGFVRTQTSFSLLFVPSPILFWLAARGPWVLSFLKSLRRVLELTVILTQHSLAFSFRQRICK